MPEELSYDDGSLQETLTYQVVETSAGGDGIHLSGGQPQILQRVAQLASQDVRFSQSAPGSPAGTDLDGSHFLVDWQNDYFNEPS